MLDETDAQKRAIRAEVRERRRSVTSLERETNRAALTENLKAVVSELHPKAVSCYLPTLDEPDTTGFIAWAHEAGIRVLLPISRDDGLLDWVASDGTETEPGLFGIPEARGELLSPLAVNDVELMLIPASGVDAQGMRLGWGRGYFDKTLGSMDHRPPVFAVIFDDELVDALPAELHDQPVDGAVTPKRIQRFG
jgi:5-formyltetrahydrofolate cyclo-ligase